MSVLRLQSLDYLAVLLVGGVTGWLIFERELAQLLRTRALWAGASLFVAMSYGIDRMALHHGWWTFSGQRLTGLQILSVPIEEYLLFLGAYIFTAAAWEAFRPVPTDVVD